MRWVNSQFLIQNIVRITSVKTAAWLTANACVIGGIVIKDRSAHVFMPQ